MFNPRLIAVRSVFGLSLAIGGLAATALTPSVSFAAPPAADAPLKLNKLTVTGNAKVATSDIMAAVPFHVGDTVTQTQIMDGLHDVMAVYEKNKVNARFGQSLKFIDNKKVEVTWAVSDEQAVTNAPAQALVVEAVNFTGNKKVSSADLTAATKLRPGSEVTQDTYAADQAAIVALYKKKGVGVKVSSAAAQPHNDNRVDITYTLEEQD
ncbi:hypothetical protein KGY14_03890 [Ameyamaea chiangmaiensis]|uniref:POTRA domain-containing protein n=1 Tax=Ameyamaea chiangmaiensis TaxID=442969 RepID=A0A850PBJ2_9PROT|nr:POTRA domain-containing protein [Ameyamaea chiangmaiensis]MBS4074331.1 hypothetical protein [Ameyamaea chiangmaiensis]NVN41318.1 hypothetical protein [Ameyamaea chiangmaiensis]